RRRARPAGPVALPTFRRPRSTRSSRTPTPSDKRRVPAMGYGEFDDYEQGPYGAIVPAGGLPAEYSEEYIEQADAAPGQPAPGEGLPADVLASLELPGREPLPELPTKAAGAETAERDMIEGFRLDLPRDGWVQFGSVLDVSGGLRKQIITKINVLAKRSQD